MVTNLYVILHHRISVEDATTILAVCSTKKEAKKQLKILKNTTMSNHVVPYMFEYAVIEKFPCNKIHWKKLKEYFGDDLLINKVQPKLKGKKQCKNITTKY